MDTEPLRMSNRLQKQASGKADHIVTSQNFVSGDVVISYWWSCQLAMKTILSHYMHMWQILANLVINVSLTKVWQSILSMCSVNSLKLTFPITTIHLQKFSKTSSNNIIIDSFADTQNFCNLHNVATDVHWKHYNVPLSLSTWIGCSCSHDGMLLCCWYSWLMFIHHTHHEYCKFCSMEIMPMTTHDQCTFNVKKL